MSKWSQKNCFSTQECKNTNLFLTLDILKRLFGEVELFACDRYIAYQSDEKSHMSSRISHYGEDGDVTPSILNFMEMGIVSKLKTDH